MKCLIVASCLLALATATPGYLGAFPLAYSAAAVNPASVSSQYHIQDSLGQYSYGYSGGPSAKQEVRTADGITRGGYSYVDGNGLVQSTSYVSDAINGFRVAATNLPQGAAAPVHAVTYAGHPIHTVAAYAGHPLATPSLIDPVAVANGAPLPVAETPEVISAKASHFQAHAVAKANLLGRKKRSPGYLTAPAVVSAYAAPAVSTYTVPSVIAAPASYGYSSLAAHPIQVVTAGHPVISSYAAPAVISSYAAPAVVSSYAAPVAFSAAAVAPASVATQHHIQDTLGQYNYGYSNSNSAKQEVRTADGITRGGYSYVDGNGIVQSTKYVSDALGFRVAATNLPVGPA